MIDIGAFECDYWPCELLENAWSVTIESECWFVV